MKKDRKANRILSAALKLFAQYGYKKTTLEDVAAEVALTKGALYFYVKNKEDLYEKSIGYALSRWKDAVITAVSKQNDVVDKFLTMAKVSYDYLSHEKELRAILLNDQTIFTLSKEEDRFFELNMGARQIIKDILIQGIKEKKFRQVDVEHATELFFSIYMMFLIKTYVKSEEISTAKMYEQAYSIVLNGLLDNK